MAPHIWLIQGGRTNSSIVVFTQSRVSGARDEVGLLVRLCLRCADQVKAALFHQSPLMGGKTLFNRSARTVRRRRLMLVRHLVARLTFVVVHFDLSLRCLDGRARSDAHVID